MLQEKRSGAGREEGSARTDAGADHYHDNDDDDDDDYDDINWDDHIHNDDDSGDAGKGRV